VRKLHGASKAPHVADTIHQAKAATKIDLIGALKSELRAAIKHTK